ncbi:MAG: hypothetical protein AABW59_00305 [archaeon]
MKFFRRTREFVFRKLKIKPKITPPTQKIDRALIKIHATEKEAQAILLLAKAASKRAQQRKDYHARGYIEDDEIFQRLKKKTYDLLGEKRAENFFDICNDPYF